MELIDCVHVDLLERELSFSASKIEDSRPASSRDMVRVILRSMRAQGLIELASQGRAGHVRAHQRMTFCKAKAGATASSEHKDLGEKNRG